MARGLLIMRLMTKTILIIDDDPAVLHSYGRLLRRLGHPVRLLGDPDQALREPGILDAVDLLLLDQRMPGMTGLDLLALIFGRRPRGAATPAVILISALLSEDLRQRAASLGVVEVIEKPVNPDRLIASVRAALLGSAVGGVAPGTGAACP